jgi:hypothetical protein
VQQLTRLHIVVYVATAETMRVQQSVRAVGLGKPLNPLNPPTWGGIATFVRNMLERVLWLEWNIGHVVIHSNGSARTAKDI